MHQQALIPQTHWDSPLKASSTKARTRDVSPWQTLPDCITIASTLRELVVETSRWKKQLLHSEWSPVQVPGHGSWSERIWVDISKMEGNTIEEPNRSIKGWYGVKDPNCQGLPTAKWNQFLWVQACQGVGSLNRHLHCGTNQQKLAQVLVPEVFLGELWRHPAVSDFNTCNCAVDSQLTHYQSHLF